MKIELTNQLKTTTVQKNEFIFSILPQLSIIKPYQQKLISKLKV